jgi:hypothetical protein
VDLLLYSAETHAVLRRWPRGDMNCAAGFLPTATGFSPTGAFAFAIVSCGFSGDYARLFWIPLGTQPTPDAVRFEGQTGVAPGAIATSNAVTLAGFQGTTPISVSGGEYRINGGAFTSAPGSVAAGQTVQVRAQASAAAYATTTAMLTMGHLNAPFFVTTGAPLGAQWWNPACAGEADLGAASVQHFDIEVSSDAVALCDGRVLVTNSRLNRVDLVDVRARAVVNAWPIKAKPEALRPVPGTSNLLVVTDASSITRVDLATGAQSEVPVGGRPFDAAPGEPGEIMVVSQRFPSANTRNSDSFSVHDLASGVELGRQFFPFSLSGSLLNYDRPDRTVITADAWSSSALVRYTYDPATHGLVFEQTAPDSGAAVRELVISPDGNRIAHVVGGVTVPEWNAQDFGQRPVGQWLSGPFPKSAAFSADGTKLLIGNDTAVGGAVYGMSLFNAASRAGERHWALPHCERSHTQLRRARLSPSGAYAFALEHCDPQVLPGPVRGRLFWIATAAPSSVPVPDPVAFAPRINAPLNSDIGSNFIKISGLKGLAVPISVIGGNFQFLGEIPSSALFGFVQDGNVLRVTNISWFADGVTTTTTLNIGGKLLHFNVTTGNGAAVDSSPDPFRLITLKRQALDTQFVSNTVLVTGIDAPAPISISGGTYSIDGGAYTGAPGMVQNGQSVTVKMTSANTAGATSSAILTIGTFSTNMTIVTDGVDATPDDFAFASRLRAPRNTLIESAPVTLSGLGASASISISGGEYRLGNGGFTSTPGSVDNGAVVRLRVLSAAGANATSSATLTVGPRSAEFTVKTAGARADLAADGRSDVLWRNAASGENYVYPMNGTAIEATEGFLRTVDLSWQIVGVGDFDGDGKADILWRNSATGQNYIYFMDGKTIKPTEGFIRTVADQNWRVAGVGDFDGDGKDDILWRHAVTGDNYLYPMDGLAIKPGEGFIRSVADLNWTVAGVADFDGDGKADILWRNSSSGQNYLYPMDARTIKANEGFLRTVADTRWEVKAVGDLDGDGNADIVWRHSASGENYLYPMSGTAIKATEGFLRTVPDTNWSIVASGDYDGDGKTDLLWRHSGTGQNYIYPMDGTTIKPGEGFLRTVPPGGWGVVSR